MSNGPVEPGADQRVLAKQLRQSFVALTLEGFTEQQALIIVGQILAASALRGDA